MSSSLTKKNKHLNYGQLDDALKKIGYVGVRLETGHMAYKHRVKNSLFVLKKSRKNEHVSEAVIASVFTNVVYTNVATPKRIAQLIKVSYDLIH